MPVGGAPGVALGGVVALAVSYSGVLPDLFRDGQGVIARGKLNGDGVFVAQEVLAKHDENYMPPEAAEALKQAGHPVGGGAGTPSRTLQD